MQSSGQQSARKRNSTNQQQYYPEEEKETSKYQKRSKRPSTTMQAHQSGASPGLRRKSSMNYVQKEEAKLTTNEEEQDISDDDSETDMDEKIQKLIDETTKQLSIDNGKTTWNIVKKLVSKNKKRLVHGEFDLDLTYVLPNVVAMGFPSSGFESWYRNDLEDVKRFFQDNSKNHCIYNLCSDKDYDGNIFQNFTNKYVFEDHNAPPFTMVIEFCEDVKRFLDREKDSIVGIHCKAGKGRTGVMICCYLLYSNFVKTALEALVYYGTIRTKDKKGVTIPSQMRYIYYFEHLMKQRVIKKNPKWMFPRAVYKLYQITMLTIPKIEEGPFYPNFQITCQGSIFYDYNKESDTNSKQGIMNSSFHHFLIKREPDLLLYDDVKVQFYHKSKKIFHFWFNTSFIDDSQTIFINKEMIDKAHKDKKHEKYDINFSIKLFFTKINDYQMVEDVRKIDAVHNLSAKQHAKNKADLQNNDSDDDDGPTMNEYELEQFKKSLQNNQSNAQTQKETMQPRQNLFANGANQNQNQQIEKKKTLKTKQGEHLVKVPEVIVSNQTRQLLDVAKNIQVKGIGIDL